MFDVDTIIRTGGIILVSFIVFAESGLLIGFFLPGDTLLFGAGLAASQNELSLPILIIAVIVAAVVGDNVGYSIGHRAGPHIFKKKDGIIFRHEYLEKSEKFYEKHGGKTIIIARFVPLVRTFAPVVAGASQMPRRRFFAFNVVGGIAWGAGMCLLGFFVGSRLPWLSNYIDLVIIGVVILSIVLAMVHLLKDKKTRSHLAAKSKVHAKRILGRS